MNSTEALTTTIPAAIRDLELDDMQGVREEIAAFGHVTSPDGERLKLVDEYTAEPLTIAAALAELDADIARVRVITVEMQRAAIVAAHEREQAARGQAQVERAQKVSYIQEALDADALSVVEVAALLGVTREAVYKMLAA